MGRFPHVDPNLDLPTLDRRVLALWRDRKVFERSLEQRANAEPFVFYEGPPTGNGRPGVQHVEARVFKDLFPRFKTMRGYRVERRGGWDCHGLPVEIEVEKALGLADKRDIEAYGIEAFNAHCRESVERYLDVWEEMTERIGFWIDTDRAYRTMDTSYIESVWWALAELHRRGLLFEDYKVVPYCPRCQTALSDAEVAQGYQEVDDLSVYVMFPVTSGRLAEEQASLLIWTTTPWTLVSNVAVAAGPDLHYVLVEARAPDGATRRLVMAEALVERSVGAGAKVLRSVGTDEIVGTTYRRPFDLVAVDNDQAARAWRVVPAGYVTTSEGTGLVHIAPAFGAEDMEVGRREGLPVLHPIDSEGRFVEATGDLAGLAVRTDDPIIVEHLRRGGRLWRTKIYRHDYPHCWRCRTPLLHYALTSWYARTTAKKDRLLSENATVGWHPEHIRDGRFGDWLANNVDWALSRARYWGTPLPLWRCEAGHVTAVESLADLSARAGRDLSRLDPHRPFVDAVTFACPVCGAQGRRVPDVLDAWFDSGAMPFSQWGYPHTGRADFESSFPADFISEAIDQTRGWFYSLLAVSILLFDRKPYQHVVCLGLLVDGEGRKMSKSLGNALDPFPLLERYGADPLRWFMLANGSPWASRRLSPIALEEITRSFLLTLWNAYAFFSLYAQLEGFDPTSSATMNSESTPLDRWALGRLAETVGGVTADLDAYDPSGAARKLTELVDDLSNWYVRLSRRRFWRGTGPDSAAAFRTLWKCLRTLTLMLAPFIPFLAEELWQGLVVGVEEDAPDSVHLAGWPEAESADLDTGLLAAMVHARRLVKLGRQARTEAGVKVRQPLARALVTVEPQRRGQLELLLDLVATELNVKEVAFPDDDTNLTDFRLIPNFRTLGPRFGRDVQAVASAVRAVPPAETDMLAPILLVGKGIELNVPGLGSVALGPDEVGVAEEPIVGWRVVRDGTASVALDLRVTPELRREGLARDLVRAVQEMRKTVGLAVEDRIELAIRAEGEMSGALAVHRDYLMAETLATVLHAAPQVGGHETQVELEGQPVHLWLRRLQ